MKRTFSLIATTMIIMILFTFISFGQNSSSLVSETNLVDFTFDGAFIKGQLEEGYIASISFADSTSNVYSQVEISKQKFQFDVHLLPEGDHFFIVDIYRKEDGALIDSEILYNFTIGNSRLSNIEFDNLETLSEYGYSTEEVDALYLHIETECAKYPKKLLGITSIKICKSDSFNTDGILATTFMRDAIHLSSDGSKRLAIYIEMYGNTSKSIEQLKDNITHELVHAVIANLQYKEMGGDTQNVAFPLVKAMKDTDSYESKLRDDVLYKHNLTLADTLAIREDGYASVNGEFFCCAIEMATRDQSKAPKVALVAYEEFHMLLEASN